MQTLGRFYSDPNQQQLEWQLVSAAFLAKPIKLLWAMSRARWNLHAMIVLVGPIRVKEEVSVNIKSAEQSARSWTVVVYAPPSFKTITSISSLDPRPDLQWESIKLPPGQYLLGLRYYHWNQTVEFPAVKADGIQVVTAKVIPAPTDINGFYRNLVQRKNFMHVCLNYYVFNLLRFKQWFPESFVKDVFLPVPNPETKFYYGAIENGKSLKFDLAPALLAAHDIYFSLYTRECFPADWYPITEPEHLTSPNNQNCVYIVRIHPKVSRQEKFESNWVKIATVEYS
ncbi:MAG: hypothetical protein F6K19_23760 [Cyanothece sp. SIO1E1]|nr:hypothetical protein [Cyanothece sp. SIO1E1]